MKKSILLAIVVAGFLQTGIAMAQTASDVVCTTCVGMGDLAKNSVTTGKIVDGTIVNVDLRDNAITGVKIRNGSIDSREFTPDLQAFLGAAIANISTLPISSSDVGVAGAICPVDRIPVSASCACDNNDGSNNFGVVFGCGVAGVGAVGGCFPEALTYNPSLPEPIVTVEALCLGAESADGTPWLPTASTAVGPDTAFEKVEPSSVEQAEWMKAKQASYESAMSDMKNRRSGYDRRLLLRQ